MTNSRFNNQLLRILPAHIAEAIVQAAEFIHLDIREAISEPDTNIQSVIFPESGVISVLLRMENGSHTEIFGIGNEGMVGLSVAMGVPTTQGSIYCQVPGTAYSIPADAFVRLTVKHKELKHVCDLYSMTLLNRVSRNAACTGNHDVGQRTARWLLQTEDRCLQKEFVLTQEFLASMLGVSRTSINIAAGNLAKKKLITYVRGKVKVLDRAGLEKASCACYASIKEYEAQVLKLV